MKLRLIAILTMLIITSLACSFLFPAEDNGGSSDQTGSGQSSKVLFQDDFSDPSSGWDRVNESDGITDYAEGSYRILVNAINTDIWSNPGLNFTDTQIEVDATKVGGDDNNDFGVICRYRDENNFYFFVLSSDGYYGIGKIAGGVQQLIGDESMPPSEAIHKGAATNHIRADCVGSKLTLYVNGVQLAEHEDIDFSSGDAGLLAGSFANPGTDIYFDNFMVRGP